MSEYIARTLTYIDANGVVRQITDTDLLAWPESVVILGEPGMGKTWLLRRIASETGWSFRSAASFVAHPDPASLLVDSTRIVLDGLDELSAARESDPVYRVLGQLIKAGCPPFILSCRAADWRGAIARQDISEEYGIAPREMTIQPFSRESALKSLAAILDDHLAKKLIDSLDEKAVPDLYGNPLTLHLFGEVAAAGNKLPSTRAELTLKACEVMWNERSDRHDKSPLSMIDRDSALAAAGATFAALILTGSEGVTLRPSGKAVPSTIPISEIQALRGGEKASAIVSSRLFTPAPDAGDQFKPVHRSIAEFLGAKWIARSVNTDQGRDRILAMMTVDNGIPASLRGIHAWLAQDERFANEVIGTDPYGVLRYGDANGLSVQQGRHLLRSLQALQQINPYFRAEDWDRHSAKGLTHPELLEDVRAVLVNRDTTFHFACCSSEFSMVHNCQPAFRRNFTSSS